MASETRVLRVPTEAYNGHNGFIRNSFTEPAQITQPHDKQLAIEAHRRAMFILNHKKREVPRYILYPVSNDSVLILAVLKQ